MRFQPVRGLTSLTQISAIKECWFPIVDMESTVGGSPVTVLANNLDESAYVTMQIPMHFQSLISADWVILPGGTGNMVWQVHTAYGQICIDEVYNTHSATEGPNTTAENANQLECLDFMAALTSLGPGDNVAVNLERLGTNINDTLEADVWARGVRLRYI